MMKARLQYLLCRNHIYGYLPSILRILTFKASNLQHEVAKLVGYSNKSYALLGFKRTLIPSISYEIFKVEVNLVHPSSLLVGP